MTKFYRVKKDTFMWEKGAILKFNSELGSKGGYEAIEDVWDSVELHGEYISVPIIEKSPEWFERVYPADGDTTYITKDEVKKKFN